MANVVSIEILFTDEALAEQGLSITASMIKLLYAPKDLSWAEADQITSLSNRFFCFGEEAAKLDPLAEHPYCSLKWLRRENTKVVLERCADIQSPVDVFWPRDFFTQLCLTLFKSFPKACFTAFCRHEETVSATVQLTRIIHQNGGLSYTEMYRLDGDEREEDDWTDAVPVVLREADGVFLQPPR